MDERKDYVDLREFSEGNGPPKALESNVDFAYSGTSYRKNHGLKAAVAVLSALLLVVTVASAFGFASFRREIRELQAIAFNGFAVPAQETFIPFISSRPAVVEVVPDFAFNLRPSVRVGAWDLEDFTNRIEVWAGQLEDNISYWVSDIETYWTNWGTSFADAWADMDWPQEWSFSTLSTWAAIHDSIIIDVDIHNVRVLPHNDNHLRFSGSEAGVFRANIDVEEGVVFVWDDNNSANIETLTVYAPHNWQGNVFITTNGSIYIHDDLSEGIIINPNFVFAP